MVSAIRGKGQKSAWQTHDVCAEATDAFARLSQYPQVATANDNEVDIQDNFVVICTSPAQLQVVTARGLICLLASRDHANCQAIPPTPSALLQHVKRAAYQAGSIWSQSTLRQPETQSPVDWGWAKNGECGM